MIKKIISLLIFFTIIHNIQASTWAILPFYTEQIEPEDVTSGPKIFRDTEKNNWELAKLVETYLKVLNQYSTIEVAKVKKSYHLLNLNSVKKINSVNLKNIIEDVGVDKLLSFSLSKNHETNTFILESYFYYNSSNQIEDRIISNNRNLWILLDEHLHKIFSIKDINKIIPVNNTPPVFFLLSASGSNYDEIQKLSEVVQSKYFENTVACAVDGHNGVFKSANFDKSFQIFLSKLKPMGGGNSHIPNNQIFSNKQTHFINRLIQGIQCIKEQHIWFKSKNISPKKLVILVDSGVYTGKDISIIKSYLRDLATHLKILIIGSASLKPNEVSFWKELVTEISQINKATYQDIIYAAQTGLGTGEEFYTIKKGNKIYKTKYKSDIENITQWDTPPTIPSSDLWEAYDGTNLAKIYGTSVGDTVVTSGEVNIYMRAILLNFILDQPNTSYNIINPHQQARLLIDMGQIPFWISFPKNMLSGKNYKLKENENYYFLLNMEPKENNIIFKNTDSIGMVFTNWENVPQILYTDIKEYLTNQTEYLYQSIGKSSIYVFFGKIKQIKIE